MVNESQVGWTTAGSAHDPCDAEELTARHGIYVGLVGTPVIHSTLGGPPSAERGEPRREMCCPTLMMEYASRVRGYAIAPLYFVDYEPGAKTHPTNLWALDDCLPEDLGIVDGQHSRVIFPGMLNPAAAIHLPARPYFETCLGAMAQVARWDYHMFQVTVPADIPCLDRSQAARAHQAMGGQDGWVNLSHDATPVRIDFTATGDHATTELNDLVASLVDDQNGYFETVSSNTTQARTMRPLYEVENVTDSGRTVSVSATAKTWGPNLISGLIGWLAARIAHGSVPYRALTMTISPTALESSLTHDTIKMIDRRDN